MSRNHSCKVLRSAPISEGPHNAGYDGDEEEQARSGIIHHRIRAEIPGIEIGDQMVSSPDGERGQEPIECREQELIVEDTLRRHADRHQGVL
jgi:hypothetical protein